MPMQESKLQEHLVALLAEGVDRNRYCLASNSMRVVSPSSRRAWIEIAAAFRMADEAAVALLAEGVDRNVNSPRQQPVKDRSPSSRRAWIEILVRVQRCA